MTRHTNVANLVAAACLALGLIATARAADKADPSGNWKWTINTPNGDFEISLKLKADGEKLTGAVTRNENSTDISDGTFKGGEVAFNVVRERDGQKFVSKYKGKFEGDSIKGKIDIDFNGEALNFDWDAKREK